MNQIAPDRYMSVKEASAYMSVSEKTVRRWIETQQLTAYRHVRGRLIRIKKSDLDRVLKPTKSYYGAA